MTDGLKCKSVEKLVCSPIDSGLMIPVNSYLTVPLIPTRRGTFGVKDQEHIESGTRFE